MYVIYIRCVYSIYSAARKRQKNPTTMLACTVGVFPLNRHLDGQSTDHTCNVAILANISLRSPRNLVIFIMKEYVCSIKASKKERRKRKNIATHMRTFRACMRISGSFIAEISVRSPGKLCIYTNYKKLFWIKVSKRHFHLILITEALVRILWTCYARILTSQHQFCSATS